MEMRNTMCSRKTEASDEGGGSRGILVLRRQLYPRANREKVCCLHNGKGRLVEAQ